MKLKSLEIQLQPSYSANAGKYEGKIEYQGAHGSTAMILDTKVSEALLVCIGSVITKFSHQVALQLEADIKQSVLEASKSPAIEAKSIDL